MIITVGSTKGGVGKTTIALQLALLRTLERRAVLLVDGDRQGSALTAVGMRAEAERSPGLACVHYPDAKILRAQVEEQSHRYEDVVIDVGGRDSAALRTALLISDLLLVPVQPRSIDVWAFQDVAALIASAQEARLDRGRTPLRVQAFLSLADSGPAPDNVAATEALAEYDGIQWLDAPVRRRKAIANATGLGLSVLELPPRDPKACQEIEELARNAFAIASPLRFKGKEIV